MGIPFERLVTNSQQHIEISCLCMKYHVYNQHIQQCNQNLSVPQPTIHIGPSQFGISIFKKEVLQPRLESTAIGTLKTLRLKKKKHLRPSDFSLSLTWSLTFSLTLSLRLPNPHLCNPINQHPHRTRSRLSESVTESTAAMDSEEGTQ